MAFFPTPHTSVRAPRFRVSTPTKVVFVYGHGSQADGRLETVSRTGGCVGMQAHLTPGALVSVQMRTGAGTITAVAEMLPPMRTGRQAFKFIAMDELDSTRLEQFVSR